MKNDHIVELFDAQGQPSLVLISPELWRRLKPHVPPEYLDTEPVERPEPMHEWDTLVEYWDFGYPVNTEVVCGECGASTEDWRADEPRKFKLRTANLGGLVVFDCQQCQSRVRKRHFKKTISTDTTPLTEKDPAKNAVYQDKFRG
jgi:hypothetical protein